MRTLQKFSNPLFMLVAALFVLSGCGGKEPTPGTTPGPISNKVSLSGTVATGAPIGDEDASVTIKDANGKPATGPIGQDGKYDVDVAGMTAPFLLKVSLSGSLGKPNVGITGMTAPFRLKHQPDHKELYSIATETGTANIHPFTDLITRNLIKDVDTVFDTITLAAPITVTAPDIAKTKEVVVAILAPFMIGAGIDISSFDLMTTPLDAKQSGFNLVLNSVKVDIADGKSTIAIVGAGAAGILLTISDTTDLTTLTLPKLVSDGTLPPMPMVLTTKRVNAGHVKVDWKNNIEDTEVVGVAGYNVFRNDKHIGITNKRFYIDKQSVPGACYIVSAFDMAGNVSAKTSELCDTSGGTGVEDTTPPLSPTNFAATAFSSSQINLSWTPPTDNDLAGYNVMAGGVVVGTLSATAASYSHTGLAELTLYRYTVVAFDTSGNVSQPPNASASTTTLQKTDTTPPSAPALTATPASSSRINLSWTASTDTESGIAGYDVYVSGRKAGSTTATFFGHANLVAGIEYCYTVQAYDAAGNVSAPSDPVCTAPAQTTIITDTVAPTATVAYGRIDPTNGSVVATITPSELVRITNNGGSASYTFSANGTFTFEFIDAAGNTGMAVATVKKATIKISTVGASGTLIGGIEITLKLPAGVTVRASLAQPTDAKLSTHGGVVIASGVTPSNSVVVATYSAATNLVAGTVRIFIPTSAGFAIGEFVTVNCDVVAGSNPNAADFGLFDFVVGDVNGVPLSAITATLAATIQ